MAQQTEQTSSPATPSQDDFAALLEESFGTQGNLEGEVIKGTVVAIENDMAVIDCGLKSEGRVPLKEFAPPGGKSELKVGDTVEVYLDMMENAQGEAVVSREKARREEAWQDLEKAYEETRRVEGVIFGRVKGGFTVDLNGAVAFLPGSQVDIRPVRDVTPLMNTPQPFQILKMDKRRGNIVVSRRAVLEEARAEQRSELMANLEEGQVREGVVKNITDYGAFVDLGGIDGLLHVTDMSWRRVNHPSEILNIGDTIEVQIIKVNPENQRISLGMKQLESDPWEGVELKYPVGSKFKGRVTNITDYGAFVELEPGIEGLVHVSEMSWTKKNFHPGKIVSQSQEVEVMVLEVDPEKRRISLGLKQCTENPWETFAETHPVGSEVEGEIKNITEFGLFVGLEGDVDGMVHLSDIDWVEPGEKAIEKYNKGDMVKAKVLDVDVEKERISLGIKQLTSDPMVGESGELRYRKGDVVTTTVATVQDTGIEVTFGEGMTAFIRKQDLARDRSEQRPERFAVGEKVDAQVTNIDRNSRKVSLSIKAREISEEKQAVAQFGSTDSGASLGEILGAALTQAREEKSEDEEAPPAKTKKSTKSKKAESEPEAEAEEPAEAPAKAKKSTKAKSTATKAAESDEAGDAGETEAAGAAEDSGETEKKTTKAKKSTASKSTTSKSTASKSTSKSATKSAASSKTSGKTTKSKSTAKKKDETAEDAGDAGAESGDSENAD